MSILRSPPKIELMERKKELKTPIFNLAPFIRLPAGVQRIGYCTETIVLDLARFSLATALCLRYNCWFSSVCIINHEIVFVFFSSPSSKLLKWNFAIGERKKKCLETFLLGQNRAETYESHQRLTSVHLFIYFIQVLVPHFSLSNFEENRQTKKKFQISPLRLEFVSLIFLEWKFFVCSCWCFDVFLSFFLNRIMKTRESKVW